MPIPYRLTAREPVIHRADGVIAVEMEAASLFAVAEAIGVDAAAVLVITDVTTQTEHVENWAASTGPLLRAFEVTLHALVQD
jgi:purine-nucleoside phosphorylase